MALARDLVFPIQEYEVRLQKTRRKMAEKGIDALLVCEPDNIYYISGFDPIIGSYQYEHLLIAKEGDPVLLVQAVEMGIVRGQTWVKDVRAWEHHGEKDAESHTVDLLKEKSLDNKTIGIEYDGWSLKIGSYLKLIDRLPKVKFVDASDIIVDLQNVKSPLEIECMRKAAEITDAGVQAGIEAVAEGVNEQDVVFAVNKVFQGMGSEYDCRWPFNAGPRVAYCHGIAMDRKLEKGDVVLLEPFGGYKRYRTNILRTVVVGKASEELKEMHDVLFQAYSKAADAMRPGVPVAEIDRISYEASAKYNKYRHHRTGYGTGYRYPGRGMPYMSIIRGDSHILEVGMTISIEPTFFGVEDNVGLEFGNNILITETGHEVLHKTPMKLFERY